MSRIKTVTHGEYEIANAILDSEIIAQAVQRVRYDMVPEKDDVAAKRFDNAANNVAQLIKNIADRRLHRLPSNHPDYKEK